MSTLIKLFSFRYGGEGLAAHDLTLINHILDVLVLVFMLLEEHLLEPLAGFGSSEADARVQERLRAQASMSAVGHGDWHELYQIVLLFNVSLVLIDWQLRGCRVARGSRRVPVIVFAQLAESQEAVILGRITCGDSSSVHSFLGLVCRAVTIRSVLSNVD